MTLHQLKTLSGEAFTKAQTQWLNRPQNIKADKLATMALGIQQTRKLFKKP
jgi:hypothetical protein